MTFKFFITPVYPYGNDHYYHEIICLAEGLKELGYKIFSNHDYWWQPEKSEYLLKGDLSEDYDVGIYDYRFVKSFEHLLMRPGYPNFPKDKKHILIDRNDWISPFWLKEEYKIFHFIFAGNLFKSQKYPENVHPWAIGLTTRIINNIDKVYKSEEKAYTIGYNFRVPHNMRKHVLENLQKLKQPYPIQPAFSSPVKIGEVQLETQSEDQLFWQTTTKRHNPEYFKLLERHAFFLSFGGYMEYKPILYQPYSITDKIKRKPWFFYANYLKRCRKDLSNAMFVFQHDNFRFYEVLYSSSVPINLDLESWDFLLPYMPRNGEHYLGIKKFNFNDFEAELNALNTNKIRSIAEAGRNWVFEHYSPIAMAHYMLSKL